MEESRQIMSAWERFVSRGGGRVAGVRRTVAESWERSIGRIGVDWQRAPSATAGELLRARQQTPLTQRVAEPVMREAERFLSATGSIMLLTDAQGHVLYSQGDDRTRDLAEDINLQPGGMWSEANIGTNAIGTALVDQAPVQIHSVEHFCAEIKKWSCAATIIRHPLDGDVVGAVDISGRASTFHPQALALAVAAASRIEGGLARLINDNHSAVMRRYLDHSRRRAEHVLLVDREGRLIYAGERARQLLAGDDRPYPKVAEIGALEPREWLQALPETLGRIRVEPIEEDERLIGAVIETDVAGARGPARPLHVETEPATRLYGRSETFNRCIDKAYKLARSDVPVLIEGETGVGKELFARAIHAYSDRHGAGYVPINAAALPRDLIESELFGYEPGTFTGASSGGRKGKIEQADGGVLGLDEIGEMPLDMQPTLLRVLEDGVVYRLGSGTPRQVSVRVLSMTNRDLRSEVAAGRFRADLYYRLSVARLKVPPLRERAEDIEPLVARFAAAFYAAEGRAPPVIDAEVYAILRGHDWPGNVRELRNVVESMLLMAEGDRVTPKVLPEEVLDPARPRLSMAAGNRSLRDSEYEAVAEAVTAAGGNMAEAARRLGIARSTLYRKVKAFGLD
ncbi:Fis family transcriptional regulator [Salinisphaera orenii MK-B5]|uniref:Fis family transcriptional regulator n=1 Tax=Salinisphaera orenii MK-B5 TaxID=856730 RepID=A0A423PNE4_9GAMM|nr:sigma-54-dependent Fis family transcriptional regulator [Salinisphaera orenii]ROO27136.1 Fis family transcriptional regulator [Salinisphaera orenii MK-B5]